MKLRADAHVHIYPEHDASATLRAAVKNLDDGPEDILAVFLTESSQCDWFSQLKAGTHSLPEEMTVHATPEPEAMLVKVDGRELYVFAGRQVVTSERLEILALTQESHIEDGQSAEEVIQQVQETGGVPVLSWAPGKWLFSRGKTVKALVENTRGPLLPGDSSLRCKGWPMPQVMKLSEPLLPAGSDPLPFPGEEQQAGRYGLEMELDFDSNQPVTSLRSALLNTQTPARFIGERTSPLEMLIRMKQHRAHKKQAASA